MHTKTALTFIVIAFNFANVDGRKGWLKLKLSQSEVGRVIRRKGQPGRRPNPKKPTALRGAVGVRDCESSDHIKGRDGACVHAVWLPRRSWRLEHNQFHGPFNFSRLLAPFFPQFWFGSSFSTSFVNNRCKAGLTCPVDAAFTGLHQSWGLARLFC